MERYAEEGWQSIERPVALETLGCYLGYGWYRAELELADAQVTTLAAPWLADRARVLVDGVDIGWLGIHPQGPRMALSLALEAGRHDLRLLVDNLGRFNYGSNTGERKGLLDTLYWGGRQLDITGGWVALWQEAVFAGEAIAAARPAAVRPDAVDVSLDGFAFQGPSVWLLRDLDARADCRYVLSITGDRNPGALFVNGVNLTRFSRHYGGGYIKQDITELLRPGANVLALNIQGYAGVPWRATLLEYDQAQPLQARWSFRPDITVGEILNDERDGASSFIAQHSAFNGPLFWRATFSYTQAIHGGGPFKLAMPGLRKGQLWLNRRELGRYWQVGPQEYYKLPVSWLRDQNELLVFDEDGGDVGGTWIGVDRLGTDELIEIALR
jgi:hypothetical protein